MLVPNLRDKTNYVVHLRNLRLYTELGMKLTKIHRVLEFSQSAWLKPYVDLCTANRKKASTDFDKDFWKLCVNSVFGKSMENVRNRVNIDLVCDFNKQKKLVAKPTFLRAKVINQDLVMIEMMKKRLTLSKPIYTGFCILELSKTLMYDFHYNNIVSRYGEQATLLFTDTDSLCYEIKTKDLYADMKQNLSVYDTSNFEEGHILHSNENKKVLGKFKVETGSQAPMEFVGLRPKMYSLLISRHDKPKMTAKGIKRGYVSKHVRHNHFLKTLKTKLSTRATFQLFRSTNHVIKTLEVDKICLSAYDDKRYLLRDGCSSFAYGHWRINELN